MTLTRGRPLGTDPGMEPLSQPPQALRPNEDDYERCRRGHVLDEATLYVGPDGYGRCRACLRKQPGDADRNSTCATCGWQVIGPTNGCPHPLTVGELAMCEAVARHGLLAILEGRAPVDDPTKTHNHSYVKPAST
ncbi:MAG: hypothetical protein LC792_06540 [Actinobacteria bacterium]|nr:hypothetical protein [Actinomycetota bacterium]